MVNSQCRELVAAAAANKCNCPSEYKREAIQ